MTLAVGQSKGNFEALVAGVEDYAIFLLSPEGNVISWNTGAQRMKGYAPEEIIGRHFSVLYTPEERESGKPRHVLHTASNEGKFIEEGWRVRKDGTRFWASVVLTSLKTKMAGCGDS